MIAIGSIREKGIEDNPWSFEERRRMVEKVLKKLREEKRGRVVGVGGVRDYPRDEDWVEAVKDGRRGVIYRFVTYIWRCGRIKV